MPFLELHIEQGRILEEAQIPVGLITAITGITQLRVRVVGQADHAGTTPMDLRHDALVGFAEMVLGIHEAASQKGRPAVATVGRVQVAPGAPNIVPGQVEFTVDIRHPDAAARADVTRAVETVCRDVGGRRSLEVENRVLAELPEAPLDRDLVRLLEEAAKRQRIPYKLMVSGAGHDAQVLSRRFPTGMVFVPSQGGRSHSPAEFTALDDIMPASRSSRPSCTGWPTEEMQALQDRNQRPDAALLRLAEDVLRRHQILRGHTLGLAEGDLLSRFAAWFPA